MMKEIKEIYSRKKSFYFKGNYRLITFDLSKQTKLKDSQQISFIGKHENHAYGATMLFIIEK